MTTAYSPSYDNPVQHWRAEQAAAVLTKLESSDVGLPADRISRAIKIPLPRVRRLLRWLRASGHVKYVRKSTRLPGRSGVIWNHWVRS